MPTPKPTLEEQSFELEREIGLRRLVYPKQVNAQRLKLETARLQQRRMIAAKKTIERVRILEEISNDIKGTKTRQVELLHDETTTAGKLSKLMEAANPAKAWQEAPEVAALVHQHLVDYAAAWSPPIKDPSLTNAGQSRTVQP